MSTYDPNNTVFIAEQVLNANQFDQYSPATNQEPHNVLWDFVQNKLLWVNTITGEVDKELPESGAIIDYKYSRIPSSSQYPFFMDEHDVLGKAWDLSLIITAPYVQLDNGNIAVIYYAQAIFIDGTFLYLAEDVQTEDAISSYWVAMRQSTDGTKLEKISELKWTSQFNDNGYSYIVRDTENASVRFVQFSPPVNDDTLMESFITTVSLVNDVLAAEDSIFDFDGATALTLYNSLTGQTQLSLGDLETRSPYYLADDDYYGMMAGPEQGWAYYRADGTLLPDGETPYKYIIGFNVLTGETRVVDAQTAVNNITNFPIVPMTAYSDIFVDWQCHGKGLLFALNDGNITTNGVSLDGTTGVWSPLWSVPTLCVRLNERSDMDGSYRSISGNTNCNLNGFSSWVLSEDYIHFININQPVANNAGGVYFEIFRFKLNTQLPFEFKIIPVANLDTTEGQLNSIWPTDSGIVFSHSSTFNYDQFSNINAIYWNDDEENPIQLQVNNNYMSNFIGSKIYDTDTLSKFNDSGTLYLPATVTEYFNITF